MKADRLMDVCLCLAPGDTAAVGRCFSPLSSLCLTLVEAAGIFSLQDLVPSFTS